MTLISDILANIKANGGTITGFESQDDVATITYIDSTGATVTKTYQRTISDTDGTETWTEVA